MKTPSNSQEPVQMKTDIRNILARLYIGTGYDYILDEDKKTVDSYVDELETLIAQAQERNNYYQSIIGKITDALAMQKVVMLEYHGRQDCKTCSLAETIEDIIKKEVQSKEKDNE